MTWQLLIGATAAAAVVAWLSVAHFNPMLRAKDARRSADHAEVLGLVSILRATAAAPDPMRTVRWYSDD